MNPTLHHHDSRARRLLGTALALLVTVAPALGQDDRPGPAAPNRSSAEPPAVAEAPPNGVRNGLPIPPERPAVEEKMVTITWNDVGVKETFTWIAEQTGKVVIPVNLLGLGNKKFTLMTDKLVPQSKALDLLFQALRLNDVAIIEKKDVVIIGITADLASGATDFPIIGPEETVIGRTDLGSLVVKFIRLKDVRAEAVLEQINAREADSNFVLTADPNSNQLVVWGDIGYCQQVEELAIRLDKIYVKPRTQTFRLRYADASDVSDNILDLFEDSGSGGSTAGNRNNQQRRAAPRGRSTPQAPNQGSLQGPEIELRVTVNAQQNSVTCSGDPKIVEEIAGLIVAEWDLPRSTGTSRIYTLHYTDPIKVADKINTLLGQSSGSSGGASGRGARGGGGGTGGDASQILSGIYQIEAFPDSNQILVFAKTEESLDFLSELIEKIDQPTPIGLPFVVELKHADAVELAEQLNALLADAGAGADISAPGRGLSGDSLGDIDSGGGAAGADSGDTGRLSFPWQRGGRQRDDVTPESSLIGRVRIVPIIRQNALAILCPKPQEEAVAELVGYFDRPGRQVMISVILVEVELKNNLSLGLRLSSSDSIAAAANPDMLFSGGVTSSGSNEDPFHKLFDSSVLDVAVDLNVVLQALDQDNNLRVLQQPVIFTADNQEAFFFDGQEIPFITNTTINNQGNPTDSFEYRNVGLILNARPRITKTKDVDLELRLEVSAVVPGQTLFGGAIIDRRTTTTHVVIKNGQTIVLSGILRESESKIVRGVPFLKDIPIIGELFKSRDFETTTSELVAFITPMVVADPEENDTNFMQERRDQLEKLIRPLSEQIEDYEANPEAVRDRMKPLEVGVRDVMNAQTQPAEPVSAAEITDLDAILESNQSKAKKEEEESP